VAIIRACVISMNKKIILLLIFPLLFPSAKAINFGSLQKNDFTEIDKNGIARFEVLFWNTGNLSYPVKLELKDAPANFFVIIQPEEFVLKPSKIGPPYEEGEYVSLPIGDVKAFPVEILVKAFDAKEGDYDILISASGGKEKDELSFILEKSFRFRIRVKDGNLNETTISSNEPVIRVPTNISTSAKIQRFDLKIIFYLLLGGLFLLIAFLVYKYS